MLRSRRSAGNNEIADFRLPIADLAAEKRCSALAIGNWQLEINK
jgi:hypothetical protein